MASLVNKALAEFLGVFIFFLAIFTKDGSNYAPVAIAVALFVAIYTFGGVSGGHFNFTVTMVKYIAGDVGTQQLLYYFVAQLLGGVGAFYVSKNINN